MISRKAEIRVLALIIAATSIPVLGTVLLISSTTRADLSDLVPIENSVGGYFVLDWSTLLLDGLHHANSASRVFSGAPVQALGYMVESDDPIREGTWVQNFTLLPEAGNLMHPAHWSRDQAIAVHLHKNRLVQFSARSLVWVWGSFRDSPGELAGSGPRYALEDARSEPASNAEIRKYFR